MKTIGSIAAEKAAAARTGTRGKHARREHGAADKALSA